MSLVEIGKPKTDLQSGGLVKVGKLYMTEAVAKIERERTKRFTEELNRRRQQLRDLLARGTDKESFDAYSIVRRSHIYPEEWIRRRIEDKEYVENLKLEYYLDHPEVKTLTHFANIIAEQESD